MGEGRALAWAAGGSFAEELELLIMEEKRSRHVVGGGSSHSRQDRSAADLRAPVPAEDLSAEQVVTRRMHFVSDDEWPEVGRAGIIALERFGFGTRALFTWPVPDRPCETGGSGMTLTASTLGAGEGCRASCVESFVSSKSFSVPATPPRPELLIRKGTRHTGGTTAATCQRGRLAAWHGLAGRQAGPRRPAGNRRPAAGPRAKNASAFGRWQAMQALCREPTWGRP